MIDRRELIHRAAMLLGSALSSGTVAGILGGCASTPQAAGDKPAFFTPNEAKTVAVISEHILPRTDTPGAIDLGVPGFIDKMLAGYYLDRQRAIVRAGLARVETDAKAAHGQGFTALTPDQQIELMKIYDREAYEQNRRNASNPDADPHFFRLLKELTTVGYFTTEYGASKYLNYAPIPGPYRADVPYSELGKAWAT
jgi:gluconate 2-dehydrogenase gamma chain